MLDYYICLGTNVKPRESITHMLQALFDISPVVDVSRAILTIPIGVESNRIFLNLVTRIRVEDDAIRLNGKFMTITTRLGCGYADEKCEDGLAELEILFSVPSYATAIDPKLLPDKAYIRPILLELLEHLGVHCNSAMGYLASGVDLRLDLARFGRVPVTLMVDPRTNMIKNAPHQSINWPRNDQARSSDTLPTIRSLESIGATSSSD